MLTPFEYCVFLCVGYICNAWFVYCVLFMRVCICSTISDHLANEVTVTTPTALSYNQSCPYFISTNVSGSVQGVCRCL